VLWDVCGGYKRGKVYSADLDVLVSCRGEDRHGERAHRGLREAIKAKLREHGIEVSTQSWKWKGGESGENVGWLGRQRLR
jgi:hypothetical protein